MSWEFVGGTWSQASLKRARTESPERPSAAVPIAAAPVPEETLAALDVAMLGLDVVAQERERTMLPKAVGLVSDMTRRPLRP